MEDSRVDLAHRRRPRHRRHDGHHPPHLSPPSRVCGSPHRIDRTRGPRRRSVGVSATHTDTDVAGAALAQGMGTRTAGNGAVVERLEPPGERASGATPDRGGRQPPRLRARPAVNLAHRHRYHPRHAQPRAHRRPGPARACVGVLVLAGIAVSPEPSAPAAQLVTHPVAAPVARSVSTTIDERARPLARDPRERADRPAGRRARGRPLGHRHRLAPVRSRPSRHRRGLHRHPGDLRAAGNGQPVPGGAGGLGQVGAQRGQRVRGARLPLGGRPRRGRPGRVLPRPLVPPAGGRCRRCRAGAGRCRGRRPGGPRVVAGRRGRRRAHPVGHRTPGPTRRC